MLLLSLKVNEMSFDYDRFLHIANANFITHVGDLRYGQYLIYELIQQYPEVSIPEEYDCFYDNGKVSDFLRYISQYQSMGHI
jgi:hypothetical protein